MKIGDFIKSAARREPEKLGLITETGRWTYQELFEFCNSLANGFLQMGIKKGDRVALLLRNGFEIYVSYFGIPRMGAVVVPLNYMMSKDELVYCLNDSTPVILIYGDEYEDYIDYFKEKCQSIKYYYSENDFQELVNSHSKEGPYDSDGKRIKIKVTDTLFIMYTGGTTGFPKGVMLTHKNITATMGSYATRIMLEIERFSDEKRAKHLERLEAEGMILTDLPIFHAAAMYTVLASVFGQTTLITHKRFNPVQTSNRLIGNG